MPLTVTDLAPPPAGKATAFYPTVTVGILNRDTGVTYDPASIALCLDGVWIPNDSLTIDWGLHKPNNPSSYPRDFAGATVTYPITNLFAWIELHTCALFLGGLYVTNIAENAHIANYMLVCVTYQP